MSSLGGCRVTGSLGANLSFFGCSVASDMTLAIMVDVKDDNCFGLRREVATLASVSGATCAIVHVPHKSAHNSSTHFAAHISRFTDYTAPPCASTYCRIDVDYETASPMFTLLYHE
jgi:hypothetical protein